MLLKLLFESGVPEGSFIIVALHLGGLACIKTQAREEEIFKKANDIYIYYVM